MKMKASFSILVNHLKCYFVRQTPQYKIEIKDYFPDDIQPNTIWITGNKDQLWIAYMKCPCGCGNIIELNLIVDQSPCWKIFWHLYGTLTISPSIWRTKGCKSHFIMTLESSNTRDITHRRNTMQTIIRPVGEVFTILKTALFTARVSFSMEVSLKAKSTVLPVN